VDPICHTLVGAALAEAGLKRRTRFGTATLLIGANLPDVDILSYAFGGGLIALSFRRGWTHGVLALAVLPLLFTGLVLLWSRAFGGRGQARHAPPVRTGQVALLAAVSILTHPLLDFMNTYGMRWLMKSGERRSPWWSLTPATAALLVVAAYAVVMLGASQVARREITRELAAQGRAPVRVMVSPVPVNPLRRLVVIEDADRYGFGTVNWLRRTAFAIEPYEVAKNAMAPEAVAAGQTPEGRAFLRWARFPFFVVEASRSNPVVHIVDARYTVDPDAGFGAVTIALPRR